MKILIFLMVLATANMGWTQEVTLKSDSLEPARVLNAASDFKSPESRFFLGVEVPCDREVAGNINFLQGGVNYLGIMLRKIQIACDEEPVKKTFLFKVDRDETQGEPVFLGASNALKIEFFQQL